MALIVCRLIVAPVVYGFIVAPIVCWFCICSLFRYARPSVLSSFTIISLAALL